MDDVALDLFLGVQTGSVICDTCDGESSAVAGCSNAARRNLVAQLGRNLGRFIFGEQLHFELHPDSVRS